MKGSAKPLSAPPEIPPLGTVLDFMRLLWAVDHALQTTSKAMARTMGVTGPQRFVLRVVGRFPGIPAGRLAKILHVHPSTLTGVLKRLEKAGLIRRRADARDGRRWLLGLTREGRLLDVETTGTVESAVQGVLAKIPEDKLRITQAVLEDVALALAPGVPTPSDRSRP